MIRQRSPRGPARAQYALLPLLGATLAIFFSLRWGGELLISSQPLPPAVDAAAILQGSILGEKARVAGAVRLWQQGTAKRILLSVPAESYWGRPVAPTAYAYIEKTYGRAAADSVDFCTTGPDVDSTEQEAGVLVACIREHGWNSVAVVTSDYHTRRAGIIWRRTLSRQASSVQLWVYGVSDPEFHARGWWRDRRSSKTWLMESTKLLWTVLAPAKS